MTPKEAIEFCRKEGIGIIDLKFTDLPGTLQHVSIPLSELTEDNIAEGYGFDGSSIRGFKSIDESDMLLMPDTSTAYVDPFFEIPTLHVICDILDPVTRAQFSRDPRHVAHKAEAYLKESGLADISYWGPRAGVLRVRLRPLRPEHKLRLLLHRLRRGILEHWRRKNHQRRE